MIIPSDITNKFAFKESKRLQGVVVYGFVELSDGGLPLYSLELKTENYNTNVKIQRHSRKHTGQYFYKTIFDGEINNPQDLHKVFTLTKVI